MPDCLLGSNHLPSPPKAARRRAGAAQLSKESASRAGLNRAPTGLVGATPGAIAAGGRYSPTWVSEPSNRSDWDYVSVK